jgi:hypothetical protein
MEDRRLVSLEERLPRCGTSCVIAGMEQVLQFRWTRAKGSNLDAGPFLQTRSENTGRNGTNVFRASG